MRVVEGKPVEAYSGKQHRFLVSEVVVYRLLTTEEQNEIIAHINRLDPEHERIKMDEGGAIRITVGEFFVGWYHPRTFLDLAREIQ